MQDFRVSTMQERETAADVDCDIKPLPQAEFFLLVAEQGVSEASVRHPLHHQGQVRWRCASGHGADKIWVRQRENQLDFFAKVRD